MMADLCVICNGTGVIMSPDPYIQTEKCRACYGTGVKDALPFNPAHEEPTIKKELKIIDYKILSSELTSFLIEQVKEHLDDGWELYGYLTTGPYAPKYQTMVKRG